MQIYGLTRIHEEGVLKCRLGSTSALFDHPFCQHNNDFKTQSLWGLNAPSGQVKDKL